MYLTGFSQAGASAFNVCGPLPFAYGWVGGEAQGSGDQFLVNLQDGETAGVKGKLEHIEPDGNLSHNVFEGHIGRLSRRDPNHLSDVEGLAFGAIVQSPAT